MQVNSSSLFMIHPLNFHSNVTQKRSTLYLFLDNCQIVNLLALKTVLKLNFFSMDLNNNFLKYTTPLSTQLTPLATVALF